MTAATAEFHRWRRGWTAGGSVRSQEEFASQDPDYQRGYVEGRAAFRAAMEAERLRLGLRPAMMVQPCSHGVSGGCDRDLIEQSDLHRPYGPPGGR